VKRHTIPALTLIAGAILVGCDTGPGCAEWRTEARLVTVSTIVGGKPTTVSQVQPVTFCVRYEEESK
jgi:hypothetical protein